MRPIFKYVLLVILLLLIAFGGFLMYMTLNDYKPALEIELATSEKAPVLTDTSTIEMLSWNIGYCGLNKEMDFFYDGGEQVYPTQEVVCKNIKGVKQELDAFRNIDFVLFQEIDKEAKRSHETNQVDTLANFFKGYHAVYAQNYLVSFVPMPVTKPMGKVNSGLLSISKYVPYSSVRRSFEGTFAWPTSIFMLDRCYLVNRYPLTNGKELLVINTHNDAYDEGNLRKAQMEQIQKYLIAEYEKGNYIIVGGDWNQCPPKFIDQFEKDVMDFESKMDISPDLFPADWTWLYDSSNPTNRRVKSYYEQGKTLTTVIDFYLLSPNISALSVKNIVMGFIFSDHQAVYAKVKLNSTK
jgi:endonuclease/exonuclease/phosphatase family metal-dependent hydrolase